MTDQGERYDRIVRGYARWWGPVLEPTALRLLDLVAEDAAGATHAIDVGTGTGTLALAAVERWPGIRVTGVDASAGMLAAARAGAATRLAPDAHARLDLVQGYADRLPLRDAVADVLVSSFVYQLVPSRGRALREAARVLASGGRLGYVTWLAGEVRFAPDRAFDDALEAAGVDTGEEEEKDDGRAGDLPSTAAAAAQLRRAGFVDVRTASGHVRHAFTPETYLGFVAEFDEEDLFRSLEPDRRARLEAELLSRLRALDPAELVMELPVAWMTARRP